MIRISTVQLSVIPGNIRANFEQMEREIQNARKQNTDIPEIQFGCFFCFNSIHG